jgi:hypothetical protein
MEKLLDKCMEQISDTIFNNVRFGNKSVAFVVPKKIVKMGLYPQLLERLSGYKFTEWEIIGSKSYGDSSRIIEVDISEYSFETSQSTDADGTTFNFTYSMPMIHSKKQ